MNYIDIKMQLFLGICKRYPLCQRFPRPPVVWQFAGRTHRIQCIFVPTVIIYYSKMMQSKISKGKKAHSAISRETQAQASKSLLSVKSYRMCVIAPAPNYDNVCKMFFYQRSSLEAPNPRFLLEACHVSFLCFSLTKIPDFQKESRSSA